MVANSGYDDTNCQSSPVVIIAGVAGLGTVCGDMVL
jgi:hypothetical protein